MTNANLTPLCSRCQRPSAEAGDLVSPEALGFTCSRCLRGVGVQPRHPAGQPPDGAVDTLAGHDTHELREGVTLDGRRVRLTLERGAYLDARPYYTVAVLRADGYPSETVRYTPFRDRAEQLFEQFRTALPDTGVVLVPVQTGRRRRHAPPARPLTTLLTEG